MKWSNASSALLRAFGFAPGPSHCRVPGFGCSARRLVIVLSGSQRLPRAPANCGSTVENRSRESGKSGSSTTAPDSLTWSPQNHHFSRGRIFIFYIRILISCTKMHGLDPHPHCRLIRCPVATRREEDLLAHGWVLGQLANQQQVTC